MSWNSHIFSHSIEFWIRYHLQQVRKEKEAHIHSLGQKHYLSPKFVPENLADKDTKLPKTVCHTHYNNQKFS